ncbi:DNA topoisomerase IB [Bordetella hinzii]|uniref:DNA topoisomerase IB n=1 Tax=Bordetella hinzii TaxID=103855 RepID=UPI0039FD9756
MDGTAGSDRPPRSSNPRARPAPGLVYTDDSQPGLRREPDGKGGFRYLDRRGRPVTQPRTLARIRALAIPPAYTDVWICARANGHLQATGRDARGRKQYRYHPEWTARRDADKFGQLAAFGAALPRIRRRVERDLALPGLPPARVLALVARLLDQTLIRIGGAEYARSNRSYGLTTLQRRHTQVNGAQIRFQFTGKSGVRHDVTLRDRRLARLLRRCLEIPGQRLFQYEDEHGRRHAVDSSAVNAYLRLASGEDFTAKHYRTWAASVMAFEMLRAGGQAGPPAIKEVVAAVARRLANTPAVCRRCYVHPAVLAQARRLPGPGRAPAGPRGLQAAERRFLAFVRGQESR